MKFGVHVFVTDTSMGPADAAQLAEDVGLDSVWVGDHSHIPSKNDTIDGLDRLPLFITCYARFYDQFVALAAMATATTTIKLGTGICLVPMREPLGLAKEVATIDHLSGGRFLFGIGAGWNHQELDNHGVDPHRRFGVMREHILAMKAIWANEVASFHGDHVNIDNVMSWPKPIQSPHPPILVGGRGPKVLDRVWSYGDGWAPDLEGGLEELVALEPRVEEFKRRRQESGRHDLALIAYGTAPDEACVLKAEELGFETCIVEAPAGNADEMRASIERAGELAQAVASS